MCRLLAVVSDENATIAQALGQTQLNEFTKLSHFHSDGWGAAWAGQDHRVATYRNDVEADSDPRYREFVEAEHSHAFAVHLRLASPNLAVSPRNSHPFVINGIAMMHNGGIGPIEQLEGMLDKESLAHVEGDTDSERYFAFVMQCVRERGDFDEGLIHAVTTLKHTFPGRSLNALFLRGETIYVVNVHEGARINWSKFPEKERHLPWHHDQSRYYSIGIERANNALVVASAGIRDGEWEPLNDETIYALDRTQGKVRIRTVCEC